MEEIFEAIKIAAKKINLAIKEADVGYDGGFNKTGDSQLKLDILSDKIIEEEFKKLPCIHSIISEEKDNEQILNEDANLIIAYDPLDGSSLVDVNLSVGSIFGIYENTIDGKGLKASAYIVYGPRVELVIGYEKLELYRLMNDEFVFIKNIILKEKGKINATGGTQKEWPQNHRKFVQNLFDEGYRLRYSGGMVPDLHQILLKGGGIFSYPSTRDVPNGKLRMLFEVFPFAFIFELAGGGAIDGKDNLLELKPKHIHDTTPCFFGSNYEIRKAKNANN